MGAAPRRIVPVLDGVPIASNPLALARAARLARLRIEGAAQTFQPFRDFVNRVYPRFVWYPHCELIAREYQRVADGETKRLMVFAPPRSGKTLLERLFFGYYVRRFPERWCGVASYGEDLARTIGRAARDNFRLAGGAVRPDVESATHWETTVGGGCWAAGVGGSITGKGMHHGGIDDPVKGAEDAASLTIQAKQVDWWQSTWYTRLEPDASLAVTMTRWDLHDIGGWLLEQEEAEDEEPERWRILHLESIAPEAPPDYPATCTVVTDDRRPGEPLCPERYPLERLLRIKARIGPYFWAALHCQRPQVPERKNTIFVVPKAVEYTEDSPDWTDIKQAARAAWQVVGGWDFGSGASLLCNVNALVYWPEDPRQFHLWIDSARVWRQTAWPTAAEDVREMLAKYGGPKSQYGDPAGEAKESDQGSWIGNLRSGGVPVWPLPHTINSTTNRDWGIRHAQYLIDERRLHINASRDECRLVLAALRGWERDIPAWADIDIVSRIHVPPKKDGNSHVCEAVLYLVSAVLLMLKVRIAEKEARGTAPQQSAAAQLSALAGAGSRGALAGIFAELYGAGR